jgi:hypothetical protein
MEDKIPTIEEFLKDLQTERSYENQEYLMYFAIDIPEKIKKFTAMHVAAALKAAAKDAKTRHIHSERGGAGYYSIDYDSILNAYPLENIK